MKKNSFFTIMFLVFAVLLGLFSYVSPVRGEIYFNNFNVDIKIPQGDDIVIPVILISDKNATSMDWYLWKEQGGTKKYINPETGWTDKFKPLWSFSPTDLPYADFDLKFGSKLDLVQDGSRMILSLPLAADPAAGSQDSFDLHGCFVPSSVAPGQLTPDNRYCSQRNISFSCNNKLMVTPASSPINPINIKVDKDKTKTIPITVKLCDKDADFDILSDVSWITFSDKTLGQVKAVIDGSKIPNFLPQIGKISIRDKSGALAGEINVSATVSLTNTDTPCTSQSAPTVTPSSVNVSVTQGNDAPAQTVSVKDCNNVNALDFTVTGISDTGKDWLNANKNQNGQMTVSFGSVKLATGQYSATVTIQPVGYDKMVTISVTLTVKSADTPSPVISKAYSQLTLGCSNCGGYTWVNQGELLLYQLPVKSSELHDYVRDDPTSKYFVAQIEFIEQRNPPPGRYDADLLLSYGGATACDESKKPTEALFKDLKNYCTATIEGSACNPRWGLNYTTHQYEWYPKRFQQVVPEGEKYKDFDLYYAIQNYSNEVIIAAGTPPPAGCYWVALYNWGPRTLLFLSVY